MRETDYSIDDNGCWLWKVTKGADGYGITTFNKRRIRAHRLSYMLHVGEIPSGLLIRHKCDVPSCVNPAHLELGTNLDNMRDCVERGRMPKGEARPSSVLTATQVTEIRSSSDTGVALADRYGVTVSTISKIRKGLMWEYLPWPEGFSPRRRKKLTSEQVDQVRNSSESTSAWAERLGVSEKVIWLLRANYYYRRT